MFKNKAWVRRPTGGGLVEHRKDSFTWSLCLPKAAASTDRVPVLFERAQESIAQSLESIAGIHTTFSKADEKRPKSCFQNPVEHDLLDTEGRKLSGLAMHRSRNAILLQGSVQINSVVFSAHDTPQLLERICEDMTGLTIEKTTDLPTLLQGSARAEARSHFLSDIWQLSRV